MFVMLSVPSQYPVHERQKVSRTIHNLSTSSTALTTNNLSFKSENVATAHRNDIVTISVCDLAQPTTVSSSLFQKGLNYESNLSDSVLLNENNLQNHFQNIALLKNCEKLNEFDKIFTSNTIKNDVLCQRDYNIVSKNLLKKILQAATENILGLNLSLNPVIKLAQSIYWVNKINTIKIVNFDVKEKNFNVNNNENCKKVFVTLNKTAKFEFLSGLPHFIKRKNNNRDNNFNYTNNIESKTNTDNNCNNSLNIYKSNGSNNCKVRKINDNVVKNNYCNNFINNRNNIQQNNYKESSFNNTYINNTNNEYIKNSDNLRNNDDEICMKINLNDSHMWKNYQCRINNIKSNNEKIRNFKVYKVNNFYLSIIKENQSLINKHQTSSVGSCRIFTATGRLRFKNRSKQSVIFKQLNTLTKRTQHSQIGIAVFFNNLKIYQTTIKINTEKSFISMNPMNNKGLPSDTPDIKAMRYYRLWIYTCNAALLLGVIIFCGAAGKVLMAEYKRLLISDLNLGQPSFIYAYLALLMQSGFLQLIGCLGALKLSEKLLNAYLLLLLLLLIGDVVLGIFWMFKFEKIMETFEPILRNRLNTDYGSSNEFTYLWNRLQIDGKCCGILGAQDFLNKSFILSCCEAGVNSTDHISVSRRLLASALVLRSDELVAVQKQNVTNLVDSAWSHIILGAKDIVVSGTDGSSTNNTDGGRSGSDAGTGEHEKVSGLKISNSNSEFNKSISTCKGHVKHGCRDFLAEWLRNTADVLFVMGYCVITFLKLSFLGILRYEIREMIQKIRLLQNEIAVANSDQELNQNQLTQVTSTSINGGLHTLAESKIGNYDREKERSRISFAEGERESLLIKEATPLNYLRKKHLYGCSSDFSGPSCTAESSKVINLGNSFECVESNYCNPTDSFKNTSNTGTKITAMVGPNSSSSVKAVQDNSSAAAAAAKSLNSSYELNEFDTQPPKYRRPNGPTITKM